MRMKLYAVALSTMLLLVPGTGHAETGYDAISSTEVSATLTLSRVATTLWICNNSTTDRIFVRIFSNTETAGASTTSYIPIPIATSAAYPFCVGPIPFGRAHPGAGFYKIAHIAAATKTPTGYVISE